MARACRIIFVLFALTWPFAAQAEKRVALVFSAERYEHLRPLANPGNDAKAVGDALEKLGFEVIAENDRNLKRMRRALDDFGEDAAGADVALVYFAGHGMEIGGQNYLLPIDADPASAERLAETALALEDVRKAAAAVAKSVLIVLDACRNDPAGPAGEGRNIRLFAGKDKASVKPGLGRVGRAENTLFAFSAAPGETAADGDGDNSPFSAALARYLGTNGLEIRSVLTLVQQEVYDQSAGKQLPYVESGLPSLFFAAQTGPLPEREALLLAMADVTPDMRAEVERVASRNDMPLAPLYGALISADLKAMTLDDRDKRLTEAALAFAKTRDELRTLASADPEVTRLRGEAEKALALGAFGQARETLEAAARIDASSGETIAKNLVARRLSEADSHQVRAGVATAELDYQGAQAAYEQAAALHERIEKEDLPLDARRKRTSLLGEIGDNYMRLGTSGAALAAYERMEAAATLAFNSYPKSPQAERDVGAAIERIGDVRMAQGDLGGATEAYRNRVEIARKLSDAQPSDMGAARDLSIALSKLGQAAMANGGLAEAARLFDDSQTLRLKLASAQPTSSAAHNDLWSGYVLIGDVRRTMGDLQGSADAYRRAVDLSRSAVAQSPLNGDWNRNLSAGLIRLGDTLRVGGRIAEAKSAYEEGANVALRLVEADPKYVEWQRDLLLAHQRIGIIHQMLGDSDIAAKAYQASLELIDRLVELDPMNLAWRSDRVIGLVKVGDVAMTRRAIFDAFRAYRDASATARQLAEREPGRADWQRLLAVSLNKVGDVKMMTTDHDGAVTTYRESQDIVRRLAESDPTNTEWQRDLSISYKKIGDAFAMRDDCASAIEPYRESLKKAQDLSARDPSNTEWQFDVVVGHFDLGHCGYDARANLNRALDMATAMEANGALPPTDREIFDVIRRALADLK